MITREQLTAYADGEASPEEAATIERAIADDPSLAETLESIFALGDRVRAAMPLPDANVSDDRLAALIQARLASPANGAEVVDLTARRNARPAWIARAAWPSAIAATLVIGLGVGWLAKPSDDGLLAPGARAGRDLTAALDSTPSGQITRVSADLSVKPVLTFPAADGALCRQFALEGKRPLAGVACREGEAWQVRALTATAAASGGEFTTAAGPGEDQVSALVEQLIAGEPLDGTEEAAKIRDKWKVAPAPASAPVK